MSVTVEEQPIAMTADGMYSFDAPSEQTVSLVRLSLRKLQDYDKEESQRLFEASKNLGFFYLDLNGAYGGEAILNDVGALFEVGKRLFDEGDLEQYDFSVQGSYFGYKGIGKDAINKQGVKDRNEFYNVSKDDILSPAPTLPSPSLLTSRRPLLASFIRSSHSIITLLLTHLESHLALPAGTLTSLHRLSASSGDQVRFTHAPPQPPLDRRVALGGHTDFGSLTVLFNRLGGLQVLPPTSPPSDPDDNEAWKYVRPLPGHAIINLGDAMVKFSAGLLRSNVHRVVPPPGREGGRERYSLVYFSRPEDGVLLRRLESSVIPPLGEGEVEEAVRSEEWVIRRAMESRRGKGRVG